MEVDDHELIFDDNSHQGCYVFHLPVPIDVHEVDDDGNDNERPRKRQKTKSNTAKSTPRSPATVTTTQPHVKANVWPRLCAGTEPEELAALRQQTYQLLWYGEKDSGNEDDDKDEDGINARIDAVIDAVDTDLLDKIRQFARSDTSSPVLSSAGRLTTALLLSGRAAHAHAQQQQLLRRWSEDSKREDNEILVQLQAHQCPNLQTTLKNLVRLAIDHCHSHYRSGDADTDENADYSSFIAAHKRLIPMPFDLELLQRYLDQQQQQQQHHKGSKVVVALPEIESFSVSLIAELVHHLSLWSDRIPFALVIGISTTVDLFEARLPKGTIRLLHAQSFYLSTSDSKSVHYHRSDDPLYSILQVAHNNTATDLFLGPSVLNFLLESTHNQSTTPTTLKRIIKYAYMSHFFANPLSVFLLPSHHSTSVLYKPSNKPFLASILRNTPSFRAYCSELLLAKNKTKEAIEKVRQLLTSDTEILDFAISCLTSSIAHLRTAYTAIDVFAKLYTHLNLNHASTVFQASASASPSELYVQLSQYVMSPSVSNTKTNSRAKARDKVLQSSSIYSDLMAALRLLSSGQVVEMIKDLALPPTVVTAAESRTTSTTIVDSLSTLFSNIRPPTEDPEHIASANTSSITPPFYPEICTFSLRHPLQATFAPQPRHAIERALSRPEDYLMTVTESASRSRSSSTEKEPTSLLFTLLCEAGKNVNIRDLWDTFSSSLSAASPFGRREEERDQDQDQDQGEEEGEEEEEDTNQLHLTLFYRALAELKMLGLVQHHSATATATSASAGAGAVGSSRIDVIARSTWVGL